MRWIWFTLLLSLSWLHASQALFDKVEFFTLQNGMKVYMLEHNQSSLTKLTIRVHTGFRSETKETSGISHLLEHLIFRDTKIGEDDYLHIIKKNGSKYINAYTSMYHTDYVCKIDNAKAEWIVETFQQMLFNKSLNEELFAKERNIVQTELGELTWYDTPYFIYKRLKEKISPKKESFLEQNFIFQEEEDLYDYYDQRNNPHFKLDDIMKHYNRYYYPANMELFIVGSFDQAKMKTLITQKFGAISKKGTDTIIEPQNAKLKKTPSDYYTFNVADKNKAYIGFRYLDKDPKESLILYAFMLYLKEKIQKEIRTKNANVYGIYTYQMSKHDAMIYYIYFDGLSRSFEDNIVQAHKIFDQSIQTIRDEDIQEALRLFKVDFLTIENDADDLMRVPMSIYLFGLQYKIFDQHLYDLFNSITPDEFRAVVHKYITPAHQVERIERTNYLFTKDIEIIEFILITLLVMVYFNIFYCFLPFCKRGYEPRHILMQRNISNIFIDFILAVVVVYVAKYLVDWMEYLLGILLFDKGAYLLTGLTVPYYYWWKITEFVLLIALFIGFYRIFNYHTKLYVTFDGLVLLSSKKRLIIPKEEIKAIEHITFKESRYPHRRGTFLKFWKPLLRIRLKSGKVLDLRSTHVERDQEDIAHRFKCYPKT